MNKFIKIDRKNELEDIGGCSLNEQDNKNIDIDESNNREREIGRDGNNSDSKTHDNEDEIVRLDNYSTIDKNIYDPRVLIQI